MAPMGRLRVAAISRPCPDRPEGEPRKQGASNLERLTAFVNDTTIPLVENGTLVAIRRLDVGNSGRRPRRLVKHLGSSFGARGAERLARPNRRTGVWDTHFRVTR